MIFPDEPLYNMILAFHIEGAIDPERFRQAFQSVVRRSDALRLTFHDSGGVPGCRLREFLGGLHTFLDLSQDPDPEKSARQLIESKSTRVFDLTEPPTDSCLIKTAPSRFIWYLNQHHLITDGWSAALVFRLTSEAYQDLDSADSEDALPSYESYVEYQETFQRNRRAERARKYWNGKLDSVPDRVRFYGRRPCDTTRTRRQTIRLGADRTRRLHALSQQPGIAALTPDISLFNLLATSLFAFLHRVSGQKDLVIGAPAHCRMTPSQKQTVGVFIEVLPLQVQLANGESFRSLLDKVATESSHHMRFALSGSGSAQLSRSFNVLLNYINVSFSSFAGYNVRSEWVHSGFGDSNHHLRVQIHDFDASGSLVLHFDFNEEVFDEALQRQALSDAIDTIDDLLEDLDNLADRTDATAVTQDPGTRPTGGPSRSQRDEDEDNIVSLFDAQARATPGSVAVSMPGRSFSYEETLNWSFQLCEQLKARGVGPGDRVGVLMTRRVELIPALLGILRSGAAYVPVDPSDPQSRVRFILYDAGVSAIVTEDAIVGGLPAALRAKTVAIDSVSSTASSNACESNVHTDDPAYLIYTSGSTGEPKGVVVPHGALCKYLSWAVGEYSAARPVDFPLFTSISFDMSVTSLFVPLLCGGRVRVYPETDELDASVLNVIQDDAVDCIKLTPSHAKMLTGLSVETRRIRRAIFGGEDLTRNVAELARKVFGSDATIYNEYGPTEATVGCIVHRYTPEEDNGSSVPIGRPLAYVTIHLLDGDGKPVRRGERGELFIGGGGLASGYWQRPQLTAERFVTLDHLSSEKLYKTGDIARDDGSGSYSFLGRADEQIKVRGYRVERAEVESALTKHPNVRSAVVRLTSPHPQYDPNARKCTRCGLSSNYPGIDFNADGVCSTCNRFEEYRERALEYFRTMDELKSIFDESRSQNPDAAYDCLVLFSGGKDSSYVLYRIVEMGLKPLCFTLDNGFISDGAKANIKRICDDLAVDHVYGATPAMNEIFVDSLKRHANVCNGCFKTIYSLAAKEAVARGIPVIVTGLSRGQLFETRLSGELFSGDAFDVASIDEMIVEARKAYHRLDDAVGRLLELDVFESDQVFQSIRFVDFYRYCDVALDEVLEFLRSRAPWIRPSDTGRSTNCLINEAGIFFHQKTRGYHNYEWPYSWDVRMGHKKRAAALSELDDAIDEASVRAKLNEIGFEDSLTDLQAEKLCAYYTSNEEIAAGEIREFLNASLPDYMVPQYYVRIERMPVTASGKIDLNALPAPSRSTPRNGTPLDELVGPIETSIGQVWAEVLRLQSVGATENFFDLGGDSILAIQISARTTSRGIRIPPNAVFRYQTIRELAEWCVSSDSVKFSATVSTTGSTRLSPAQARFLDAGPTDPHNFCHVVLLSCDEPVDIERLELAARLVREKHPVLRSAYEQNDGIWHQYVGRGQPDLNVSLVRRTASVGLKALVADAEARLLENIDLESGRIMQLAAVDGADESYVVVAVHHLAVDALSWPIIVGDLAQAYNHGEKLPPSRSLSFRQWMHEVEASVSGEGLSEELRDWLDGYRELSPIGPSELRQEDRGRADTIHVSLDVGETARLKDRDTSSYRSEEYLMAALARLLSEEYGGDVAFLDIETHGRAGGPHAAELSESVGWFTAIYPCAVEVESKSPAEVLASVRKELSRSGNIATELEGMRYLSEDSTRRETTSQAHSDVLFNYLGRYDELFTGIEPFAVARELRLSRDSHIVSPYSVVVNCFIHDDRLHVSWTYWSGRFSEENIERMANRHLTLTMELVQESPKSELEWDGPQLDLLPKDKTSLSKLAKVLDRIEEGSSGR